MSDIDYMLSLQETADTNAKYLKLAFLAVIVELRKLLSNDSDLYEAILAGDLDAIVRITSVARMDEMLFGVNMDKDTFIFNDEIRTLITAGAMAAFYNLNNDMQKRWNFNPIDEYTVAFLREDGIRIARELATSTEAGMRMAVTRIMNETADPVRRMEEIKQVLGLTEPQTQALMNFKRQLETRQLLGFTPPDERRLEVVEQTIVRNHMKNGFMTDAQIDAMVTTYYESLLNKRALDIAATESMRAVNNGQQLLWEQGLREGIFSDDTSRRFWVTAGDEKVRTTHRKIPGMNPYGVKIRSQFLTPFGPVYGPGDYNVNLINCRCVAVLVP